MSVSTESRFKDSFPVRSLTLLKTKFVCSSPQSGSLKVQAASGYMFKLQGAVRQEEGEGKETARVRLGWPCAQYAKITVKSLK